jgi:hypothetical protein
MKAWSVLHVYSVTMGDDTSNAGAQLSLPALCARTNDSIQKLQKHFRAIRSQLDFVGAQIRHEQKVYSHLDAALKASKEALQFPPRRVQATSTPTMCKKQGCCNKAEPRNYGYCLDHRQLGQSRRGQPGSSTVNHRGPIPNPRPQVDQSQPRQTASSSVGNKRPSQQSHSGPEAHLSKVARTDASQVTSATPRPV